MPGRKWAPSSPTVANTTPKVPLGSQSLAHHALRDITAVIVAGLALLGTAYWLINQDFMYIYLSGAIYATALVYFVSTGWLRNTFVVVTAVFLSLMAGEFLLGAIEDDGSAATLRKDQHYTRGYSQPLRANGGPLGYAPYPNRVVEAWKIVGSDRIYDVTYTIDSHGLRKTPGITASAAARSAFLFFGGSFTFGEGLNDDETLPYQFAKELRFTHPVVNFGFSGYGPHQMLRSIELGILNEVVSGPVQAAVYVALPGHVDRAAGKVWWDPVGPKYELDFAGDGAVRGSFYEGAGTFHSNFLQNSADD